MICKKGVRLLAAKELIMLGTGSAMVTHCFNTCFVIRLESGECFMTDAGGGNGILRQLELAHIDYGRLHHLFLTHTHTDHVLGVIWVIRKIATLMNQGSYDGDFHIYCHVEGVQVLQSMAVMMLKKKDRERLGSGIYIHEIHDRDVLSILDMELTVFDIHSTKALQFGYTIRFADGLKLTCLGDEPYDEHCRDLAKDSDWLLSEAFCLYGDRDRFKPYEKHHSTVKEACETAAALQAKHLVLYHTEDKNMAGRKNNYTDEGQSYFSNPIYVPDDLETIMLQ
jgi:ribonuclease Z